MEYVLLYSYGLKAIANSDITDNSKCPLSHMIMSLNPLMKD
jgi:hypothetical protein